MSEADMRQCVIAALRPLDAISVENSCYPGTPDVNYIDGWIELKWARNWPANGGPLRLEHYTKQQKVWARRRRHRGGMCWLLLQVGRDWLLFHGEVAAEHLGESTREQLIAVAHKHWSEGLWSSDLLSVLCSEVSKPTFSAGEKD